jgi:hypothetical protein
MLITKVKIPILTFFLLLENFLDVLDLSTKRLFIVLRDSSKLNFYRYDAEMTVDLFYQISNGYLDSPELRVTWLSSLLANHLEVTPIPSPKFTSQHFCYEEAAVTTIHIASLVNEYLNLQPGNFGYPGGNR